MKTYGVSITLVVQADTKLEAIRNYCDELEIDWTSQAQDEVVFDILDFETDTTDSLTIDEAEVKAKICKE